MQEGYLQFDTMVSAMPETPRRCRCRSVRGTAASQRSGTSVGRRRSVGDITDCVADLGSMQ